MLDHVYLHTSNLDNIRVLKEDPFFENVYLYPREVLEKTSPNEYGMLKTKNAYYHILVGQIRRKGCPYCGSEPDFDLKVSCSLASPNYAFCQCSKCGARGPMTACWIQEISNRDIKEHLYQRAKYMFENPRDWDFDLNRNKIDD